MPTPADLQQEIDHLKARNARVEQDKAWETSWCRKILLCTLTYALATLVMWAIGVAEPYLNALIPTLGFYLSTLTLHIGKRAWVQYAYRPEKT